MRDRDRRIEHAVTESEQDGESRSSHDSDVDAVAGDDIAHVGDSTCPGSGSRWWSFLK